MFNIGDNDHPTTRHDMKNTILACRKLGVKIEKIKPKNYKIYGKGLGSFSIKKNSELILSNSKSLLFFISDI